jgi:hypothetical protein
LLVEPHVRLAFPGKTLFLLQLQRQGKLRSYRFHQIARHGRQFSARPCEEHAVEMTFPFDGSPKRAAQTDQGTNHRQILGNVEFLVDAFAGGQQFLRQRRFERQLLPFLGRVLSLGFPDLPAKTDRCMSISASGRILFEPDADAIGAAIPGENMNRFEHNLGAGCTGKSGPCRSLPRAFFVLSFTPGPHRLPTSSLFPLGG